MAKKNPNSTYSKVVQAVASGQSLKDIKNDPDFSGSNPSTLTQYYYKAKRELKALGNTGE
jgi:hypothetical protein